MNKFRFFDSNRVKEVPMKEMIVVRALGDGLWEIQVLLRKDPHTLIERGKRCRV